MFRASGLGLRVLLLMELWNCRCELNSKHANVGLPLPEQKLQGICTRGRAGAPAIPDTSVRQKKRTTETKTPNGHIHKRTVIPPDRVLKRGDTCPQGPSNMAASTSTATAYMQVGPCDS